MSKTRRLIYALYRYNLQIRIVPFPDKKSLLKKEESDSTSGFYVCELKNPRNETFYLSKICYDIQIELAQCADQKQTFEK